jgi:hypothetical protein
MVAAIDGNPAHCNTCCTRWAWMFALAWLVAGCGTTQPHRLASASDRPCELPLNSGMPEAAPVWEVPDARCSQSWAVRFNGKGAHGINYVEIDEQGIIRDREAAEQALQFATETRAGRPAYVIVYIHGWFHDAAADDGNVQAFHSALASVRQWHDGQDGRAERDVRGIFIGWRGASLKVPWLKYLTFWDRKSTSEEVGRGALLEFLLRLEQGVKSPQSDPRNRLILVGHSFGASVAFNSLAHVFLQRFLEGVVSQSAGPRFRGYGDLVVLINPAIEAMRYMPFQSAVQYYTRRERPPKADFSNERVPRLVVLSSEGDWATRRAFPLARWFSTVFEAHHTISALRSPDGKDGTYNERGMDVQTVGNYGGFHTHTRLEFGPEQQASPTPVQERGALPAREACRNLPEREIRDLLYAEPTVPAAAQRTFPDSNFRLAWTGAMPRYLPYLLLDVDEDIISGHSDIGHPKLVCWINQLADGE